MGWYQRRVHGGLGDEERRLMHLVPAPAVKLMKSRVLSRPGLNSVLAFTIPYGTTSHFLSISKVVPHGSVGVSLSPFQVASMGSLDVTLSALPMDLATWRPLPTPVPFLFPFSSSSTVSLLVICGRRE